MDSAPFHNVLFLQKISSICLHPFSVLAIFIIPLIVTEASGINKVAKVFLRCSYSRLPNGIIIREKTEDEENASLEASDSYAAELSRHFDSRILEQPSVAVDRALSEVIIMGNLSLDNIKYSVSAVMNNDQDIL